MNNSDSEKSRIDREIEAARMRGLAKQQKHMENAQVALAKASMVLLSASYPEFPDQNDFRAHIDLALAEIQAIPKLT